MDDLGVVRGADRRRHRLGEHEQVLHPPDRLELTLIGELLLELGHLDPLVLVVHVHQDLVDRLVLGQVEVVAAVDNLKHLTRYAGVEDHRPQQGALVLDRARRLLAEQLVSSWLAPSALGPDRDWERGDAGGENGDGGWSVLIG